MACTNGNATCIPIGPTGATGATGADGAAGADGTNGSVFEHFDTNSPDFGWVNGVDTLVTGMTHTLTGPTGNYAVQFNLLNNKRATSSGSIKLFVNGVNVHTWGPIAQGTLSGNPDQIRGTDSSIWRGNITNGDVVEVKTIKTTDAIITTVQYSWMIQKLD